MHTHALVESKKKMPQEPDEGRTKWLHLMHHLEQIFYMPLTY